MNFLSTSPRRARPGVIISSGGCSGGEILKGLTTVFGKERRHFTGAATVHEILTPEEAAEERRLWADYYESVARILEIMRRDGTTEPAVARIVAEDTTARRAIARLKQLHRIPELPAAPPKRSATR
jgi:hypothetical protein